MRLPDFRSNFFILVLAWFKYMTSKEIAGDLRLFGGTRFAKVGMRAQAIPCKCNGGIIRSQSKTADAIPVPVPKIEKADMWPQAMGDGTDAITNTGNVTKPIQQGGMVPQGIPSFGPVVKTMAYVPGAVSDSVPIDKRTLLYTYGYV